jgi:hypothetical protein
MGQKIMEDIDSTRFSSELENHRNAPIYPKLAFEHNNHQDTQVYHEDARSHHGSVSGSSNNAHYGHTRQESTIIPAFIPDALSIYKTPPATAEPNAGSSMASFPSQRYYRPAGDVSNHSYMPNNSNSVNSSGRPYSWSTDFILIHPSTSSQRSTSSMNEEEYDEMSEIRFTDNRRSDSTTDPFVLQSIIQDITDRRNQSISFEPPRSMSLVTSSVDRLCQDLMSEMQYDVVYVAEVLSGKQVRMLDTVQYDVTDMDPSFLLQVLRQDRVQQWTATSVDDTFAMGDVMFLHPVDSTSTSEDRSSGIIGVCLRKLVPTERRVRCRDLIRLGKFRVELKTVLATTPPTRTPTVVRNLHNELYPVNEAFPAGEATEVVLPDTASYRS